MTSTLVFTNLFEELETESAKISIYGDWSMPFFGAVEVTNAAPSKDSSKDLTLYDLRETLLASTQDVEMDDAFAMGAICSDEDLARAFS